MQVKQFIVDLENNNKKVYTVFYNEDGKVLRVDLLYFKVVYVAGIKLEVKSEEIIYAVETENQFHQISDINPDVLEKIWIKYCEEWLMNNINNP